MKWTIENFRSNNKNFYLIICEFFFKTSIYPSSNILAKKYEVNPFGY